MKTSHILCILKILAGLCLVKQRIKTKNTFVNVVCSVLVVKKYELNSKKSMIIVGN